MDDEVKILLFQGEERGSRRSPTACLIPAGYTWPIPGTIAPGSYDVRVRTFDNAEATTATISISPIPAQPAPQPPAQNPVAIVKPNGSESIPVGDLYRIQWNAVAGGAADRTVDLLLCRDGRPVGVVAENLPVMQRNFDWRAGRLLVGSAGPDVKYKMRIRVDGTTIEDDSDRSFALVAAAGAARDVRFRRRWRDVRGRDAARARDHGPASGRTARPRKHVPRQGPLEQSPPRRLRGPALHSGRGRPDRHRPGQRLFDPPPLLGSRRRRLGHHHDPVPVPPAVGGDSPHDP